MSGTISVDKLIPCDGLSHDEILLENGPQCLYAHSQYGVVNNSWPIEGYAQDLVYTLLSDSHLPLGKMECVCL